MASDISSQEADGEFVLKIIFDHLMLRGQEA